MKERHEYVERFLSSKRADSLFTFLQTLPRFRTAYLYHGKFQGWLKRLSLPSWSEYGTFRGVAPGSKNSGSYRQEYKDVKDLLTYTMDEAPRIIRDLAIDLSRYAGKPVNYFSLVGYENENDHIDWHQHGEDRNRDARVFIVSLGAVRHFGLREICPKCRVCDECNKAACDGHTRACKKCKKAKMHKNGTTDGGKGPIIKPCPISANKARWDNLYPAHGSMIVIPSDYNFTHEHAVLDSAAEKTLRISFNTKCLIGLKKETLEEFIKRMQGPPMTLTLPPEELQRRRRNMAADLRPGSSGMPKIKPANEAGEKLAKELLDEFRWDLLTPRVWDGHAGEDYPPDAVYVGCKTMDRAGNAVRQGTPFGNAKDPSRTRSKSNPKVAENEKDFRVYAEKKMQDPAFAKQVKDDLRGKHLLCWCVQDGPKRDKFCHARVWLELANPDMQEEWDDPPKGPDGEQIYFPNFMTPAETQAIYDAYMKLGFKPRLYGGSSFLRFPEYSDVITPRMKKQEKKGIVDLGPFSDAPEAVRKVIARISKKWKRNINYVSTIGYENENSDMFYHQHGEDQGHDTPVWILTTGEARTFALREKDEPKTEIRFQVEPGSLLMLPNSYNVTHQHAVLKDKTARGMRIAPNMKAMDDIYYGKKGKNLKY